MRNTTGDLFSVFDSNITITKAAITSVTPAQVLIYLSHSLVDITAILMSNLALNDAGSLATVFDESILQMTNVVITNVTSSEHGVISLQESSLGVFSSTFSWFNASLIVAEQASVGIYDSQVSDVLISFAGKTLSMLPSGGLLSCTNCPIIHIANTHCRNLSANQGGVIYAQVLDSKKLGEIVLEDSSFEGCTAKTAGGVVKAYLASVFLRNCTFTDNKASAGGVVDFEAHTQLLRLSHNSFLRNEALLDGSCIRWLGTAPEQQNNTYEDNKAQYGNPEASIPHHFALLTSASLPVNEFPVQGVTGQQMAEPLIIGVFDAMNQLIVTNNSTLITLLVSSDLTPSGNTEANVQQGVATFSLLFAPFSTETYDLTFYAPKENITQLAIQYRFRDCQAGEIRTISGCFPCQKNSYSFNPSDPACLLCPAHAVCYGRAEFAVDVDYWRANNLTDDIYPCLVRGACRGGVQQACAPGYTGTLCGACEEGYYQYGMWQCRKCEHEVYPEARGVIVAVLAVSVTVFPAQLFLQSDGYLYRFAIVFRVFMNYAHTMLFVVLLHVQWPFTTLVHHEVLRVVGSLGSVLVYSGCQYEGLASGAYYFQVIATTFYPLLLIAVAGFFWSVAELKLHYGFKKMTQTIAAVSLAALYTFVPPLSLVIVSMYQCQEVAGSNWLVADLSKLCRTGKHLFYVECVTIPLVIVILAYHFLVTSVLKRRFGAGIMADFQVCLKAGFKTSRDKWEFRIMLRKSLLLYLSLAYPKLEKFSQIVLFSCIIGMGVFSEVKAMPYVSYWLNWMNLVSNLSVFVIVLLSNSAAEVELTAVSCIGTLLVLVLGGAALREKRVEPKKAYNEEISIGAQPHSNFLLRASGDNCESLTVNAPPSTPQSAEKPLNLRDISLVDAAPL